MMQKPFRPPSFKKPETAPTNNDKFHHYGHINKKRRLDDIASSSREGSESTESQGSQRTANVTSTLRYEVLWRKFTNKKHKTWDGDGLLTVANEYAQLQDEKGHIRGRTKCTTPLLPGSTLSVGGLDVEIQDLLPPRAAPPTVPVSVPVAAPVAIAQQKTKERPVIREIEKPQQTNVKFNSTASKKREEADGGKLLRLAAPSSYSTTSHFKTPLLSNTVLPKGNTEKPTPRHDPNAPGALVMKKPRDTPAGKQLVDVVVDPILSGKLRDHQREGVKFLYECVMGMQPHCGTGAILADEMGLGKTLQVITLLWTMLKQNPIYDAPPLIKKALIVCPVSLIKNWRKEFRKWLGLERIGVFILDGNRTKVSDFTMGRSYSVMIVGYEKLRLLQEDLQKGSGIDIVIADEGHRLRTAQNKSAQAIKSLDTERRVILSGTPLQNDLSELYFMVDFVNPGLLGKASAFKRSFETPILNSRQPGASSQAIEKGRERSEELAELTGTCILRRTAEILAGYLPPKTEYVLFCTPTAIQSSIYRSVLATSVLAEALRSSDFSFQLINVLKKLCNSPSLLKVKEGDEQANSFLESITSSVPTKHLSSPGASCKLQVLDSLLYALKTTTDEKVVIVSHYTSTLDILQNLLNSLSYTWLRLDGSTAAGKRQELVDKFNRADASKCFAFLLSAKSGGTGLNLVGASRLILFDIDWNPSTDLQAMARIHRDGQKRHCRIYRLLTRGALDEKIYQRQLNKLSLADAIVDSKASASSFTTEELRQLFSLDEVSACPTHDLLGCACSGRGAPPLQSPGGVEEAEEGSDSESEGEEVPIGRLMKASEVDMERQERLLGRGEPDGDAKLIASTKAMLMQYRHFDVEKSMQQRDSGDGEEQEGVDLLRDDAVLAKVLSDAENRVSYAFVKPAAG